jgi:hypothetical protein
MAKKIWISDTIERARNEHLSSVLYLKQPRIYISEIMSILMARK